MHFTAWSAGFATRTSLIWFLWHWAAADGKSASAARPLGRDGWQRNYARSAEPQRALVANKLRRAKAGCGVKRDKAAELCETAPKPLTQSGRGTMRTAGWGEA